MSKSTSEHNYLGISEEYCNIMHYEHRRLYLSYLRELLVSHLAQYITYGSIHAYGRQYLFMASLRNKVYAMNSVDERNIRLCIQIYQIQLPKPIQKHLFKTRRPRNPFTILNPLDKPFISAKSLSHNQGLLSRFSSEQLFARMLVVELFKLPFLS